MAISLTLLALLSIAQLGSCIDNRLLAIRETNKEVREIKRDIQGIRADDRMRNSILMEMLKVRIYESFEKKHKPGKQRIVGE